MSRDEGPGKLLELGLSFWQAKVLLTAVELGVFAALARPQSADELTATLQLDGRGVRDFLDVLMTLGLLERTANLYSNAHISSTYLVPDKPEYVGGALEMANARLYPVWDKLAEALRTGKPQNEAKEEEERYYQNLQHQEQRLRMFLRGMTGLSMGASRAIAHKFPWHQVRTFCDVGGAQGGLAVALARAHTHLSGAVFELPAVEGIFHEYVQGFDLAQRVHFLAGDFFEENLPSADVLIMGHVLHNWDLEKKRVLIAKAFDALPSNGSLIVYEALIDDERERAAFGMLMSLNMLLVTAGGFVFSAAECRGWMLSAGFASVQVQHLDGPDWMVVASKGSADQPSSRP